MSQHRHKMPPVFGKQTISRQSILGPIALMLIMISVFFALGRWTAPSSAEDVNLLQARLRILTEQSEREILKLESELSTSNASIRQLSAELRQQHQLCENERQELLASIVALNQKIEFGCPKD